MLERNRFARSKAAGSAATQPERFDLFPDGGDGRVIGGASERMPPGQYAPSPMKPHSHEPVVDYTRGGYSIVQPAGTTVGIPAQLRRDYVLYAQEVARKSREQADPRSIAPDGTYWNDLAQVGALYGMTGTRQPADGAWQVSFTPTTETGVIHLPPPSSEATRYDWLGRPMARKRDRGRNGLR